MSEMTEEIVVVSQSETAQALTEACGCPCVDMTELADASFPESLAKLPTVKVTGCVTSVRFVSSDIEGSTPTDTEIAAHVQVILDNYGDTIMGWLMKLGCLTLPGFVGEEPTIDEFFREDFDPNRVKPRYVLVSYPVIRKSGV